MGRVPLQVGTGGKQEQNQPWAKSQHNGDGWQAGARTAVGREPIFWGWKAGAGTAMGRVPICGYGRQAGTGQQGHFCFAERERTTARQQGHFCVSRKGTDGSRIAGAFLLCRKGTDSRAAFEDREPKQERGGRQTGQHLRTGSRSR